MTLLYLYRQLNRTDLCIIVTEQFYYFDQKIQHLQDHKIINLDKILSKHVKDLNLFSAHIYSCGRTETQ